MVAVGGVKKNTFDVVSNQDEASQDLVVFPN